MKVAFEALIKSLATKSLVSGDLESRLILQFSPTDDSIMIVLMDDKE